MAQKIDVQMPQDLDLVAGWTMRVTAVDSSGNAVTTVKASNVAIIADSPTPITTTTGNILEGDWLLVPGPGS